MCDGLLSYWFIERPLPRPARDHVKRKMKFSRILRLIKDLPRTLENRVLDSITAHIDGVNDGIMAWPGGLTAGEANRWEKVYGRGPPHNSSVIICIVHHSAGENRTFNYTDCFGEISDCSMCAGLSCARALVFVQFY